MVGSSDGQPFGVVAEDRGGGRGGVVGEIDDLAMRNGVGRGRNGGAYMRKLCL